MRSNAPYKRNRGPLLNVPHEHLPSQAQIRCCNPVVPLIRQVSSHPDGALLLTQQNLSGTSSDDPRSTRTVPDLRSRHLGRISIKREHQIDSGTFSLKRDQSFGSRSASNTSVGRRWGWRQLHARDDKTTIMCPVQMCPTDT